MFTLFHSRRLVKAYQERLCLFVGSGRAAISLGIICLMAHCPPTAAQDTAAGGAGANSTSLLLLFLHIILGIVLLFLLPRLIFPFLWSTNKDPFLTVRLAYMLTLFCLAILFVATGFYPRYIGPLLRDTSPYTAWYIAGTMVVLSTLLTAIRRRMPTSDLDDSTTASTDLA